LGGEGVVFVVGLGTRLASLALTFSPPSSTSLGHFRVRLGRPSSGSACSSLSMASCVTTPACSGSSVSGKPGFATRSAGRHTVRYRLPGGDSQVREEVPRPADWEDAYTAKGAGVVKSSERASDCVEEVAGEWISGKESAEEEGEALAEEEEEKRAAIEGAAAAAGEGRGTSRWNPRACRQQRARMRREREMVALMVRWWR
jgi:hypothetical protein